MHAVLQNSAILYSDIICTDIYRQLGVYCVMLPDSICMSIVRLTELTVAWQNSIPLSCNMTSFSLRKKVAK